MRYCINCDAEIGSERFCNQCGADNGAAQPESYQASGGAAAGRSLPEINVSFILRIAAAAAFVIAAIVMLSICLKQVEGMSVQAMLYTGNAYIAVIFFAMGMWSCIPALLFILNIKRGRCGSVTAAAVTAIIIMAAMILISAIFKNSEGLLKYLSVAVGTYKSKAVVVIILEAAAAALGTLSPRIER